MSLLSGPTASLIVLLEGSTCLWEHYLIPTGRSGVLCILTLNLNTNNNFFSIPFPDHPPRLGHLRALIQPGLWTPSSGPQVLVFFSLTAVSPAACLTCQGGKVKEARRTGSWGSQRRAEARLTAALVSGGISVKRLIVI